MSQKQVSRPGPNIVKPTYQIHSIDYQSSQFTFSTIDSHSNQDKLNIGVFWLSKSIFTPKTANLIATDSQGPQEKRSKLQKDKVWPAWQQKLQSSSVVSLQSY